MTAEIVWVEPWSGNWMLWGLIPLFVGAMIALMTSKGHRADWILSGAFASLLMMAAITGFGSDMHDDTARQIAVESAGYTNVHMDGREFTAADTFGDYAEGTLAHVEGNFWAVIRLDREAIEPVE